MQRFAGIGVVVLILASVAWVQPVALGQDDEDLEDAVVELTEIVAELEEDIESLATEVDELSEEMEDVDELREEIAALRDEFVSLEEQVQHLDGGSSSNEGDEGDADDESNGGEEVSPEQILGTWAETSSNASNRSTGAYKYTWNDLELLPDGTYRWGEAPYETGSYEVHSIGEANLLGLVLVGEDGLRCTGIYELPERHPEEVVLQVPVCPDLATEPTGGGEPQELNAGYIQFTRKR